MDKKEGKKSSSIEQQEIEKVVFKFIETNLSIKLEANPKIFFADSHLSYIQPDFYSESEKIIGEIFAHIGTNKKAQDNKIANDILKMLLLERKKRCKYRKILVICDDAVLKKITGNSALSESIREFEIEIIQVKLSEVQQKKIMDAQIRQKMINA